MSNKLYMSSVDLESHVHTIIRKIIKDDWRPDYIVGIGRGGLVPATMLSHYLEIPMHTLDVSLRDSRTGPTCNAWMPEDAVKGMKILIVDDMNDTGATLKWIQQDWRTSIQGYAKDTKRQDIFSNNVRIATLVDNESSKFNNVNYTSLEIDKSIDDVWICFPWEGWWKRKHTQ